MRIPSGKTDVPIGFVAIDSTDGSRKTGLSSFTVYRSRKGGAAVAYATPTVAEISAANMPGLYSLLVDEDTTIDSGSDSEEYAVHITATGMAPVTRTIELYRRDVTSGKTLTVDANNRADASVGAMAANVMTAAAAASDLTTEIQTGLATAAALVTAQTSIDDLPTNAELATALGTADDAVLTQIALVKAKTDNLPTDPADASDIAGAFGAVNATLATLDARLDTEIPAIKAKTDLIPAAPAAVGNIPTAIENADAFLNRDLSVGTDSGSPNVRTSRQALRFLRNKWAISAGVLTVFKEDDATASWTGAVATDAAADPVISNDPAGP